MPQPIPYQGSKRIIAQQILQNFPQQIDTLIEPFSGSAAISIAASYHRKAKRFLLNDLNEPLMELLETIINNPHKIADDYELLWRTQIGQRRTYYDFIRDEFNKTHRPDYFLYLLARCVKASVRYNASGEFNQSPDNRRKGRRPISMRQEIVAVSHLLQGKTIVTSGDYKDILETVTELDLVYMDPPYQGTSQTKDPRYYRGLALDELVDFLMELNKRHISYLLSYDGRTGKKTYGNQLPAELNLHQLEIYAGRSTQSTLLGKNSKTYESLYLSPTLTQRLQRNQNHVVAKFMPVQPEYRNLYPEQMEIAFA